MRRLLFAFRDSRLPGALMRWVQHLAPDRILTLPVLLGPLAGRRIALNLRYRWGWGYLLGIYEKDVEQALRKAVKPGDVVYDVGAHMGYHTLLAAQLAAPGPVIAFEPHPLNQRALERTIALNSDLNIKCVPKAAGDRTATVSLICRDERSDVPDYSGLARIADVAGPADAGAAVSVEMVDLDSFCAQSQLWPNVIKIDVEGAEGLVLHGMAGILSTGQTTLIIEAHDETACRQVFRLFLRRKSGYNMHCWEAASQRQPSAGAWRFPVRIVAEPWARH